MLESDNPNSTSDTTSTDLSVAEARSAAATDAPAKAPRKRAAKKASPVTSAEPDAADPGAAARKRPAKKAAKAPAKSPAKAVATSAAKTAGKRAAKATAADSDSQSDAGHDIVAPKAAKSGTRTRGAKRAEQPEMATASGTADAQQTAFAAPPAVTSAGLQAPTMAAPSVLFVPPAELPPVAPARPRRAAKASAGPPPSVEPAAADKDLAVIEDAEDRTAEPDDVREAAVEEATGARRRRRRGRRGRGGGGVRAAADGDDSDDDADERDPAPGARKGRDRADSGAAEVGADAEDSEETDGAEDSDDSDGAATTRRRRRRRTTGGGPELSPDDPPNTVVHVRPPRDKGDDDGVKGVKGSTRLEAKRQRRKDGRDTSRRRPPILTEAEFLARREAVDRVMAVRQNGDRTQVAVLEDDVLVEHYVTRASATSYVGNVYLGRVQNVLPSMEAAFVDIGKGRNGVLYAGEVNWDAAGLEGKSRAIEQALKSGDVILVQVTKDPIGHKGARLTSQVSLPGRFLVYVPGGAMTGISRRLPDTERHRLKAVLKKIVPEDAGVIVRTAAEGATEEELTRDVERLQAQWESISKKAEKTSAAPSLVHGEPDLAIRVVRDVFNEDFNKLIVQGDGAWDTISEYVDGVAPDLAVKVARHSSDADLFHELRVDEQLMKALDRKVWLPSGGSLVIDRTEAMTVVDVNTGKFVGTGGNLEQTVTRNNLEAAEEIVRQLRLRDVGGIVVIDFIDMVLESNRDLVLRRLTECLGRDRTKHQVAEVTSLGLVQMTRKRVGEGLLEAFSEPCEVCRGRGVIVHSEPVDHGPAGSQGQSDSPEADERPKSKRKRGGSAAHKPVEPSAEELAVAAEQRRAALAAISAVHRAAHPDDDEASAHAAAVATYESIADNLPTGAPEPEQSAHPAPETAPEPAPEPTQTPDPAQTPDPGPEAESEFPAPGTSEHDDDERWADPTLRAPVAAAPRRRRAASRPAGPPAVAANG